VALTLVEVEVQVQLCSTVGTSLLKEQRMLSQWVLVALKQVAQEHLLLAMVMLEIQAQTAQSKLELAISSQLQEVAVVALAVGALVPA